MDRALGLRGHHVHPEDTPDEQAHLTEREAERARFAASWAAWSPEFRRRLREHRRAEEAAKTLVRMSGGNDRWL